jgi:hypothetical protein
VGVGAGFSSCFCLMNTLYFGLYPKASMETSWFSTGLKSYTSNMMDVRVGMRLTFLPGGFLSLHAEYIPSYRIRYARDNGELRTFQGRGWNWGVRWVIPERILPTFTLLGMKIDFRRIALRFNFSRIKDSYTGTQMKIRGLGISYMLR